MPVWRTVATSCRAALLARAQVNPLSSNLHALFANSLLWLFDVGDPIDVNAYLCCHAASIQFAGDNLRVAPAQEWDTPTPDLMADRTSTLVRPKYHHHARLESHRYKTIGCRCCGR